MLRLTQIAPFIFVSLLWSWQNQRYGPTHDTSTPVFKQLNQITSFKLKRRKVDLESIFLNQLPFKEKRKRKFVRFYESVQTGSILSSTGVPGSWLISARVISGISFSTKSTSLMTCYSSSWIGIARKHFFWRRASILCGRTILIDCMLAYRCFYRTFLSCNFCCGSASIWCPQNKGHSFCKYVPWVQPLLKVQPLGIFVLTFL